MPSIPFAGGAYQGISTNVNAQICRNFYVEIDPTDTTKKYLIGTPGLLLKQTLATSPVRGLHAFNGVLYAVAGSKLYELSTSFVATEKGTLSTSTGIVSMADNGVTPGGGNQLIIVDGTSGYTYNVNTTTFAEIADADFPDGATFVTFQDGYFVVNLPTSGRIYISGLYDGTSWAALDFATAEGSPDKLLRVINESRNLWLIGERTSEVWANTGQADFPFERYQGGFTEYGTVSGATVCKFDNSLIWLGRNDRGDTQVVMQETVLKPSLSAPQASTKSGGRMRLSVMLSAMCIKMEAMSFTFSLFLQLTRLGRLTPLLKNGLKGR